MVLKPFERDSHRRCARSNRLNVRVPQPRAGFSVFAFATITPVVIRRVLVVDDDEDLRFLLKMALDRDGVSMVVGEATNGRDAIDAAREHQPDIIVLDQSMPVMNGTEAIPGLRAAAPTARIVMYSAYAETDRRVEFERLADAVLVKGGPMRDLLDLVTAA